MPTATTATSEYSPSETLKPANRNVASDGIGMQALSATMSRKIPGSPIASTTSTANCTIGSVSDATTSTGTRVAGCGEAKPGCPAARRAGA